MVFGNSKVKHFDDLVFVFSYNKDVLWLQVAMNDAVVVRDRDGFRKLAKDDRGLFWSQPALA